jgi:hypothetical protein
LLLDPRVAGGFLRKADGAGVWSSRGLAERRAKLLVSAARIAAAQQYND